jgi:hypothetical protein
MKLEQQVCSLELARKVKELGVQQDSLFYWSGDDEAGFVPDLYGERFRYPGAEHYSAFTVAELGILLPTKAYSRRMAAGDWWECGYEENKPQTGDTEADARAKMLVYLLENNLIDPRS